VPSAFFSRPRSTSSGQALRNWTVLLNLARVLQIRSAPLEDLIPVQEIRDLGRKRILPMLSLHVARTLAPGRTLFAT
jgi:hypothetical protein